MMDYILAIDQSTAGTKGVIFAADGRLISRVDLAHEQITNEQGWIEHSPTEILNNTIAVSRMVVEKAGINISAVRAVGISNQRETVVCWDKVTGKPLYNAIVWQCGRAAAIADRLADHAAQVAQVTGLQLSPFFSAAKIAWMLENVPEVQEAAAQGRLCCGTVDAWLVYSLTEERAFKTDYSNASRTQLLNLDRLCWDKEMCSLFGVDLTTLPEICDSDSVFGHTTMDGLFNDALPICSVMGDSHAALYANGCHQPYMAKATFGTGTSVMMNVGNKRPMNQAGGVVTSLAWGIGGKVDYVLEGNINFSGAIIKWLVDHVHLISSSAESGTVAQRVGNNGGVYLVPAFSGLGAPYWRSDVRAMICGMNSSTTSDHIVRAGVEAIIYQIRDIVEALNNTTGNHLSRLCVDGGATKNTFLMQFAADMIDTDIGVSQVEELSAAGVAYMAAISCGSANHDQIFKKVTHKTIHPRMDAAERDLLYNGWQQAVNMLMK